MTDPASPRDELEELLAGRVALAERYPDPLDLAAVRRRFAAAWPERLPVRTSRPPRPRPRLAAPVDRRPSRPPRVVIATPDVVGPVRNGGIGTAYTALARALAAAGHEVTILYTLGERVEAGRLEAWIARYRADGVGFVPLPRAPGPARFEGPRESWDAWRWLRERDGAFDVVHFPEWRGHGFYALQAKRLGLAFRRTTFCVGVHSPTLWHDQADGRPTGDLGQLEADHLERRSVATADVVVCPTRYLMGWLDEEGWEVPDAAYVLPNVAPVATAPRARARSAGPAREVVFFGRLETRKGLELFCDAIDRLDGAGALAGATVTFLGKAGRAAGEKAAGGDGAAFARRRAAAWSVPARVLTELDQAGALAHLAGGGALAVLPSLTDNAPNTVLECLATGVPFVATAVGGIPELVAEADHGRCLVRPEAGALAAAIAAARAAPRPAAAAEDPEAVRRTWVAWHEAQVPGDAEVDAVPSADDRRPLVSVCMPTRNRGPLLRQAVESVAAQSWPEVELVLADDGSDDPASLAELDRVERELRERNTGRVVRGLRRYPGAARNAAAFHARGEYLLFMDDDNVALPHEVETLVAVARRTGIPILTCALDAFAGPEPPPSDAGYAHRWAPLGAALPLGLFRNCLGDTNALVRRDVFFAVGGFEEAPGTGLYEDWIFFLRAGLKGFAVEAVPEVLFRYRLGAPAAGPIVPRQLAPWLELLPEPLAQVLLVAAGVTRWTGGDLRRLAADEHAQARLAARFAAARPLLRLGPEDAADLEPVADLEVSPGPDGVALLATGDDPGLRLPPVDLPAGVPAILRIELSASSPALAQLFWWTARDRAEREERSVLVPLETGRNERFVEIPGSEPRTRLRLDPAMAPGAFVLHGVELRVEGAGGRRRARRPIQSRVRLAEAERTAAERWAEATTLWRLGPGDAGRLRPLHGVAIRDAEGSILLESDGTDPHLRLPAVRVPSGRRLLVELELEAPAATEAQLFWGLAGLPWWREPRSLRLPLARGANRRRFALPAGAAGPLRLDPGALPGVYRLLGLEVRAG